MKLKEWLSLNADDFHGTRKPMEASSWLNTMEKYMEVWSCHHAREFFLLHFSLKAWLMHGGENRAAHDPVHGEPTWEFFVQQFTSRYYLESFKEEMYIALTKIEQGDQSVDEYDA
jgi:hypothetical protein